MHLDCDCRTDACGLRILCVDKRCCWSTGSDFNDLISRLSAPFNIGFGKTFLQVFLFSSVCACVMFGILFVMHQSGSLLLPTLGVLPDGTVARVSVLGANFGPSWAPLEVTLVSAADGIVRVANSCLRDAVSHSWVRCSVPGGVGTGHRWRVAVGGLTSAPSAATTSYAPPTLTAVIGNQFNTDGNQNVFIVGTEFGPLSDDVGGVNDRLIFVAYGPMVCCNLFLVR